MNQLFISDAAKTFSNEINAALSSRQAEKVAQRVPDDYYALRECLYINEIGSPYASITGPLLLDKMMAVSDDEHDAWNFAMWLTHVPFDVVLQMLLKHQLLDAKKLEDSGWIQCPIMTAIERDRPDWLNALLKAGAATDVIAYRSKTSETTFNLLDYANYKKSWVCADILSNEGMLPTCPFYTVLGCGKIPEDMQRTLVTDSEWVEREMADFVKEYKKTPAVSAERMRRMLAWLTPDNVAHFHIQSLGGLKYYLDLDKFSALRSLWAVSIASGPSVLFSANAPVLSPFTHQHPGGVVMQLLLCALLHLCNGSKDELAVSVQWLNEGWQTEVSDELVLQVSDLLKLHEIQHTLAVWKLKVDIDPVGLNDFALKLLTKVCNKTKEDIAENASVN